MRPLASARYWVNGRARDVPPEGHLERLKTLRRRAGPDEFPRTGGRRARYVGGFDTSRGLGRTEISCNSSCRKEMTDCDGLTVLGTGSALARVPFVCLKGDR